AAQRERQVLALDEDHVRPPRELHHLRRLDIAGHDDQSRHIVAEHEAAAERLAPAIGIAGDTVRLDPPRHVGQLEHYFFNPRRYPIAAFASSIKHPLTGLPRIGPLLIFFATARSSGSIARGSDSARSFATASFRLSHVS